MKFLHKINLLVAVLTIFLLSKSVSAQDEGEEEENEEEYETEEYDKEEYEDDETEYDMEGNFTQLPEECRSIALVKLKQICKNAYPEGMETIYDDTMVDHKDPYAVYQFPDEDDTNRYFLTFHRSPLLRCKFIEVINAKHFKCTNETGHENDIYLKVGFLKCLNHPSEMVDQLLVECSPEDLESSVFSALHYAGVHMRKRTSSSVEKSVLSWSFGLGFTVLLPLIYFQYKIQ